MRGSRRAKSIQLLGVLFVAAALAAVTGFDHTAGAGDAEPSWSYVGLDTPAALDATTRQFDALAAMPDGEQHVLYGGVTLDAAGGDPAFADTWTWESAEWTARCGTAAGGAPDPCGPGSRAFHGMATGATGVLLYGGAEEMLGGPVTVHNDTWRWNGSSWAQVCDDEGGADPCGPRAEILPALAGNGEVAVLFGGFDADVGLVDDTWVFDGNSWTHLCGTSIASPCGPSAREAASMAWDGERFVLFGGGGLLSGTPLSDTWVIDPDTDTTWTQVCADDACGPADRVRGGAAYLARPDDTSLRGVVMSGGFFPIDADTTRLYRDAWFWDGESWREVDVPWDSEPFEVTSVAPPGLSTVFLPVQGSRSAQCEVVWFGNKIVDGEFAGTATFLGGWDVDGDGEPGDCTETVPTTTTTTTTTPAASTTTVPAASTTTVPAAPSTVVTTPPPTLPATGSDDGAGIVLVAAGVFALVAGLLILVDRHRSWLTGR